MEDYFADGYNFEDFPWFPEPFSDYLWPSWEDNNEHIVENSAEVQFTSASLSNNENVVCDNQQAQLDVDDNVLTFMADLFQQNSVETEHQSNNFESGSNGDVSTATSSSGNNQLPFVKQEDVWYTVPIVQLPASVPVLQVSTTSGSPNNVMNGTFPDNSDAALTSNEPMVMLEDLSTNSAGVDLLAALGNSIGEHEWTKLTLENGEVVSYIPVITEDVYQSVVQDGPTPLVHQEASTSSAIVPPHKNARGIKNKRRSLNPSETVSAPNKKPKGIHVYEMDPNNPPEGYTAKQIRKALKSRDYHERRKTIIRLKETYRSLRQELKETIDDARRNHTLLNADGELNIAEIDKVLELITKCINANTEIQNMWNPRSRT